MQPAGRLDHAAILAHGIVRDLAALYPDLGGEVALRTLAVELHRARELFRRNYPLMGIKFDLAVKERWGADPLLVFEATGASTAEAERAVRARAPYDVKVVEKQSWPPGRIELAVKGYSPEEAELHATFVAPTGGTRVSFEPQVPPRRGFLGIGKRLGTWKAVWDAPCRARIVASR